MSHFSIKTKKRLQQQRSFDNKNVKNGKEEREKTLNHQLKTTDWMQERFVLYARNSQNKIVLIVSNITIMKFIIFQLDQTWKQINNGTVV